jgi:hypothetical protein
MMGLSIVGVLKLKDDVKLKDFADYWLNKKEDKSFVPIRSLDEIKGELFRVNGADHFEKIRVDKSEIRVGLSYVGDWEIQQRTLHALIGSYQSGRSCHELGYFFNYANGGELAIPGEMIESGSITFTEDEVLEGRVYKVQTQKSNK